MNNIKNTINRAFTVIPNALINDRELDRNARFLFIYMASKPDDWEFYNQDLADGLDISTKTLLRYVKALERAGWITRRRKRLENNQFDNYEYFLHNSPEPGGTFFHVEESTHLLKKNNIGGKPEKKEKNGIAVLDDPDFIAEMQAMFPDQDVQAKAVRMKDWLLSHGRTYKNYRAALRNWLRSDQEKANAKSTTNTDKALTDAKLNPEQLERYNNYYNWVLANYPELFRSECRILSQSEYVAYSNNQDTPTLPIHITDREKTELLSRVHEYLNTDKFSRNRNATVYKAYLAAVRSTIAHQPVKL